MNSSGRSTVIRSLLPTGRQPVAAGVAAALLAFAAGWALLPQGNKQNTVDWFADLCSTVSRPMFSSAPAPAGSGIAARPATLSKVISCEPLPNVPGKSVTTLLVDFPPLAYSPAHRHPGSVTAVILAGTIRSQIAGSPPGDYRFGETFFEPPGALHMFAENPDPVHAAKLVAVFVTEENCGPLVLPP
ncbi:cupin domain-containing protein [Variovorax sp. J22P271]|uniref:cupin domain-containing protein n=1 Tax=Variovorax davisae TaxID=3053515 RepID=UPI002578C176|nr:cupin domain-containing protein [Variovorax sp. J22P271]MDM0032522.1 cupin domain-containing protein [Variovorax sp. J22P271]